MRRVVFGDIALEERCDRGWLSYPFRMVEHMCDVHRRVEAGGLDRWSDAQLAVAMGDLSLSRGHSDADEALVLAELVRRGRHPEAMFGNRASPREAQRRTRTAIALCDGSLPGAAEALAAGEATLEHVAALAELNDRLPEGAAEKLLPLGNHAVCHATSGSRQ